MSDEVVQTPFGKFLVDTRDLIESTLKAGTLWDGPSFLQVIAKEHAQLGTPYTTILDVGANVGSFSIWCAHHGAWRVIAVEPVPSTMQRLKANLDLNQASCADVVIPLQVAAYDNPATLYVPQVDLGNRGGTALQPASSQDRGDAHWVPEAHNSARGGPLDDFQYLYGDRVSLIKIDAEGCDGAILRGLAQTLRRDHPAVVFEWDGDHAPQHGYPLVQTITWLEDLGYRVHPWPSQVGNYLAVWDPEYRSAP